MYDSDRSAGLQVHMTNRVSLAISRAEVVQRPSLTMGDSLLADRDDPTPIWIGASLAGWAKPRAQATRDEVCLRRTG
jgi:hypothetical protein